MILDQIVRELRSHPAFIEAASRGPEWEARARSTPSDRDFVQALRRPGPVRIVAEVKKASPSRGVLRADLDPVALAKAYEAGGADAISVVTEPTFFQGQLAWLEEIRHAVALPVLRKDFIVEPWQVEESRAAGADAVLLIARLLDEERLREFRERAEAVGMAALVEVHNEDELHAAVRSGATVIGINNRDLGDFTVDVGRTLALIPQVPPDVLLLSESGVDSAEVASRLHAAGCHALLVGESLVRSSDPATMVRTLRHPA